MYLFIYCLLARSSLILATSLLLLCWRMVSATECQGFVLWKRMFGFRGVLFASPFCYLPLPSCLQNTSVGRNLRTVRGHNEPGKEDSVMKNSTCRYNVKERKF